MMHSLVGLEALSLDHDAAGGGGGGDGVVVVAGDGGGGRHHLGWRGVFPNCRSEWYTVETGCKVAGHKVKSVIKWQCQGHNVNLAQSHYVT